MIILTKAQADLVRGDTGHGAALMPIPLIGGLFVLPEAVLADDSHEMHHDFLAGLPRREIAENEWIKSAE